MQRGKVEGRTLSADGSVINTHDDNPFLNTLTHDVGFEDVDVRERAANMISEKV